MKEKKVKTKFQKFLIFYSSGLGILMVIFLFYVGTSLVKYEKNQPENFLTATLKQLEKENLNEKIMNLSIAEKGKWETENNSIEQAVKEIIKDTQNITYKQKENTSEEHPTYEVYYKKKPLIEITLKEKQKVNRLGLLTFSIWDVETIHCTIKEGLYSYIVNVPSTYQITINGKELTKEDQKEQATNEVLSEITKYVEIPTQVRYEITGLFAIPEIKIKNEKGELVNYNDDDGKITIEQNYQKIEKEEIARQTMKSLPDVINIAKNWSLFLSKDLKGPKYGYSTIKEYIAEGSELEKYAYNWATGVDITFTSSHTLASTPFTEERVENFLLYSENAFSCEVYLVKHMIIKGNKKLDDIMHDRMYFARINNEWKLVNMESITEGEK